MTESAWVCLRCSRTQEMQAKRALEALWHCGSSSFALRSPRLVAAVSEPAELREKQPAGDFPHLEGFR